LGEARKGLITDQRTGLGLLGALLAGTLGDEHRPRAAEGTGTGLFVDGSPSVEGTRWWVTCVTPSARPRRWAQRSSVQRHAAPPEFARRAASAPVVLVGQIAFWVEPSWWCVTPPLRPALIAVRIVASWPSAITLLLVALAVK
jgi:hypothetical protein